MRAALLYGILACSAALASQASAQGNRTNSSSTLTAAPLVGFYFPSGNCSDRISHFTIDFNSWDDSNDTLPWGDLTVLSSAATTLPISGCDNSTDSWAFDGFDNSTDSWPLDGIDGCSQNVFVGIPGEPEECSPKNGSADHFALSGFRAGLCVPDFFGDFNSSWVKYSCGNVTTCDDSACSRDCTTRVLSGDGMFTDGVITTCVNSDEAFARSNRNLTLIAGTVHSTVGTVPRSGLSGGAIAGIVAGVIGGVALVGVAGVLVCRRQRKGADVPLDR
ncbi:hypothetical protein M427DRAFT_45896 [Gonapodya prolifera JEL478]|uniref:Uncharacterized protein n=1 Tax=Gonapodya prolifera (strain JEL478) TaxID=1344416 RepID=A0A139A9K1_GONPJ|nr:hypothetical protein M427DRAFT_45896 [Gonapodya prolifera JEL478]|eukprot:KXS13145.1 hypothetical protein M427DRAFT_45896 [Gonapodya prolifera JEL478]